MAQPITSPLRTILLAVRDKLVDATLTPVERVRLVKGKQIQNYQGDAVLLVAPGRLINSVPFAVGTGRLAVIVDRELLVKVRTRNGQDVVGFAESWLTDETLSHFNLEEATVAALHIFQPADDAHNVLLQAPMQFVDASEVDEDKKNPEWGETLLRYTIKYQISMSVEP